MHYCPYCESAKKLLKQKGYPFEEILLEEDDEAAWENLEKKTGYKTMPQIFIGDEFIGGYQQLAALNNRKELDEKLK